MEVGTAMQLFCRAHVTPDVVVRTHVGLPLRRLLDRKPVPHFDTGRAWSLHQNGDGWILRVPAAVQSPPFHWASIRGDHPLVADLFVAGYMVNDRVAGKVGLDLEALIYPLGELLVIWLLAERQGVLVHACGIRDGGQGYLFAGNSGHGKTTLAQLWQDRATILNDDRIVVRKEDGRFWMYGTPWHGDFRQVSAEAVPLTAVFFLSHSDANSAIRQDRFSASTKLFTRCFPPLWDRESTAQALAVCDDLAASVPCYDLAFAPDESAVDFVRSLAAGAAPEQLAGGS